MMDLEVTRIRLLSNENLTTDSQAVSSETVWERFVAPRPVVPDTVDSFTSLQHHGLVTPVVNYVISSELVFDRAIYATHHKNAEECTKRTGKEEFDEIVDSAYLSRNRINWFDRWIFFKQQQTLYKTTQNNELVKFLLQRQPKLDKKIQNDKFDFIRYKFFYQMRFPTSTFARSFDWDRSFLSQMINVKATLSVRISVFQHKQADITRLYHAVLEHEKAIDKYPDYGYLIRRILGRIGVDTMSTLFSLRSNYIMREMFAYDHVISTSKRRIEGIDRCLERYRTMYEKYGKAHYDGIRIVSRIDNNDVVEHIFSFLTVNT